MADYQRFNRRSVKLSDAEVREAVRLYYEEGWDQGRIGRKFNVTAQTIGRYVRGESRLAAVQTAPVDDSEAVIDPNAPPPSEEELAASMAKFMEKMNAPAKVEPAPTDYAASLTELARQARERRGATEETRNATDTGRDSATAGRTDTQNTDRAEEGGADSGEHLPTGSDGPDNGPREA